MLEQVCVSVIVPFYNSEKYIKNCLSTLLAQDFKKPFEIIMVDDASTDSGEKIIKLHKIPFNLLDQVLFYYGFRFTYRHYIRASSHYISHIFGWDTRCFSQCTRDYDCRRRHDCSHLTDGPFQRFSQCIESGLLCIYPR